MHPLEGILRFRRLSAQNAQQDLERATQLLRAATVACERQSAMVAEQRACLAQSWMVAAPASGGQYVETNRESDPCIPAADVQGWLIEEAALEFSGWNRMQLEQVCVAEAKRIEPLVERFMECRRSLRQTERLIEQHAELARAAQERKTQAEADDWFLQQGILRSRHERLTRFR